MTLLVVGRVHAVVIMIILMSSNPCDVRLSRYYTLCHATCQAERSGGISFKWGTDCIHAVDQHRNVEMFSTFLDIDQLERQAELVDHR